MIRDNLRSYLATSDGVLQIPRLLPLLNGSPLVDVTEEQVSYHPRELPKIHISIGSESSEEDTNQFDKTLKSATLTISTYINRFDPDWKPYNTYYFKSPPMSFDQNGAYTEDQKDKLRVDLEEISQELEYRIRREDPVAHVKGVSLFALSSVRYSVDETTSPITGILVHDYQIEYFQ